MTIALSGTPGSSTWTGGLTSKTFTVDYGSTQANAFLVMATAVTAIGGDPPVIVKSVTDNRGLTWLNYAIVMHQDWVARNIAFSPGGDGSQPPSLVTQIWGTYDTASPATGHQIDLSIGGAFVDDSGTIVPTTPDAGIAIVARLSGVNPSYPWDGNPNSAASTLIDLPYGTLQNPDQVNTIGSNTTNIAVLAALAGVGTLQVPSNTTDFVNNGVALTFPQAGDVQVKQVIPGYFDGGPAVNELALALHIKAGVTGPWNKANNYVRNENGVSVSEFMTMILTSDAQPARKRLRSRIIT
jgi:hypothetical protein